MSLFDSDSRACWRALRTTDRDPRLIEDLLDLYVGRFAIDFAYEEWATDYRDHLHAAVLGRAEAAISSLAVAGDFDAAISVGHRVLAIDPEADGVELALLRNYKASGLHAAAAEQYSHYATYVRDALGVDPPSFDEI